MFKGFYNLTSAMLTQGRHLDVLSNNMTNVSTAGYKTDRFTSSTFKEAMWLRTGNKVKDYTELGGQSFITAPSRLYTDFGQGAPEETGIPLDFCIQGDGYFAVNTPNGVAYTRNGNFMLDEQGFLYLPGQGQVLSDGNAPIQLGTDKIIVDKTGVITDQEGRQLGRIGLFTFGENADPEKNEQGMFVGGTTPVEAPSILQGFVERSNIDMVREMTEMISAERAYQSAAQITKIYDGLMTKATTEVGHL